jgi:membrane-associated phospholipid phosphatase
MSASLAATLSRVFHPLLSALYLVILLGLAAGPSPLGGLLWAALVLLVAVGLPAADLWLRVRAGRVGDWQIVVRQQRLRPLLVGLACAGLALVLLLVLGGPRPLVVAVLAGLACGLLLTAVTFRWKISFHAAVPAASAVLLGAYAGLVPMVLALVILALVGWSRLRLGRHSTAQVLAGGLTGFAGAMAVVALFA